MDRMEGIAIIDTEVKLKAWKDWIAERPPAIRAVAELWPPTTCYRMDDNPGHYAIVSYQETQPVTVTIRHLPDSYGYNNAAAPGVVFSVFGIEPETLTPCGCLVKKAQAA